MVGSTKMNFMLPEPAFRQPDQNGINLSLSKNICDVLVSGFSLKEQVQLLRGNST